MRESNSVEQPSPWERITLGAGVFAGTLFLVAMALFIGWIAPAMPPIDAPAPQHTAFYAEQSRNPLYTLIRFLIIAQLAPLPLFFGGLYALLRRIEGPNGGLAGAVFAAGILVAPITPLVEMIEGHLLLGLAAAGGDPLVTRNFDGMTPMSFALSGFPQAVVLAGTGIILLTRSQAPRWIGWLSLALTAWSLLGTATLLLPALFFLGTLSAIFFKLWMVLLAVVLLRKPQTISQAASVQAAPRGT